MSVEPKARSYTKRRSDLVLAFCGGVVVFILGWRHDSAIADAALTWCFVTILGVLGIYQTVGHADLRAMRGKPEADK